MRNRRNTRRKNVVLETISNKNFIIISSILLVAIIMLIGIIKIRNYQDKMLVLSQAKELENQKQEIFSLIDNSFKEIETSNQERIRVAKISAVGDILCQMDMIEDAKKDETYNFDSMFKNVEHLLRESDIGVGTIETNFTENEFSGVGKYNTPIEFLSSVKKTGINLVSMAHNHQLDYGIKGLKQTIENVQGQGFSITGIKENKENENKDFSGIIKEINGIKIAFLGYTYGLSNEKELSKEEIENANIYSEELAKKDLEYAKENSNFIITIMHWGEVNNNKVSKEQENIAGFLVDNGVDMILGSHPAVVEPMKIIQNKEGKNILVAYSLGNYITSFGYENANVEIILNIEIAKKANSEKAILTKVDYTPIYILDNGKKAEDRFELVDMKKLIIDYANGDTSKITRKTYDELIRKLKELQETVNSK